MKAILITDNGEPVEILDVRDINSQDKENLAKICEGNARKIAEQKEREANEKEARIRAIENALEKLRKGVDIALGISEDTVEDYQNEQND